MNTENKNGKPANDGSANKKPIPADVDSEKGGDESAPAELLDGLPFTEEATKKEIISMLSVQGRVAHPIASKLTEGHIHEIITNSEKREQREYDFLKSGRIYTLVYTVVGVSVFFALFFFIGKHNEPLFEKILTYLGTFVAGIGVGWGYRKRKEESG